MRTFRKKILLGYGASLLLIIVVLSLAVVLILRLGRASESILRENYQSIQAAENMIDAVERQDSATLLILLGYQRQGASEFRENETLFLQWLGRAKDNITISGEKEIIDTLEKGYARYLSEISNLQLLYQSAPTQAANAYHEAVLPLFRSIRDACIKLRDLNHETMYAASNRANKISVQAVFSISVIGGVSVLLVIVFSMFVSHLISRPVTELKEAALQVAQANYNVQVPVRGSDEVALLATQFNLMVEKLKQFHDMNIGRIIAEKRKSEAIIRSVDDGIVVVDDNFLITNFNPEAAKIFGVFPEDSLEKHILEVMRDERLFGFLKEALASGQPPRIEEGEDILTIKTGEESRHYQVSIVPMRTPSGVNPGVVLLLRDITRHRELDRLKSEFVMTASHELRTPLTSINMAVDLLRESAAPKLTDQEQALLEACHEDVQRLRALVNDLLDLSKIEAGKLELSFEPVQPHFLCDQALSIIKSQAESKGIELNSAVPQDLPEVTADPHKIVWVLVNLLANAMRYTKAGGHIKLAGDRVGNQVQLAVTDDGEGIPFDLQPRIFDKFVHGKPSDGGGSGLGLAISKEIVKAHRGAIWVDSSPGQGSTFTFTLPIAA
ncbi:MAG: cell wall metabolism sensor histidine kinase WalK [Syntrophobacterales bacterium]|jgi:NtrC-family two-component system sensor histidine kinase KinB|nr:cell wall metabolism sensor histidine kinase WalK [Syntrophobacterales bacterium]